MKKPVSDWTILAEKDIKAASMIINEEYLTNIAAFHCQQAIDLFSNPVGCLTSLAVFQAKALQNCGF
jgi:hypothetical protein